MKNKGIAADCSGTIPMKIPFTRRDSLPLAIVSLLIFTQALAACSRDPAPEAPVVARPIRMLTIGQIPDLKTLELPGSVSASQSADLAFEVAGRMQARIVEEGQLVQAGEVVARLDAHDFEAERDRMQARRNTAKADYDRYAKAFESNAVTEQQVSRSKGMLEVAEANLRVAQRALQDTQLRAPFPGRIARRLVDDFATVQAKEPVLVLQDESSLEMRVNVAERDWVRADTSVGLDELTRRIEPRIIVSSRAEDNIPAFVKEISNIADPVTRTYQVTFGFSPPEAFKISPGMTGKVTVDRYTTNVENLAAGATISVPANAVVADDDNNAFVWLVDASGASVSRQPVSLGEVFADNVRIVSGLSAGDRIAISGVNNLTEGMLVRDIDN